MQLLTVTTGSRLHGLNKADSDTDFRGVFTLPLTDLVDPFKKPVETRWIEGETKDDTSFELRHFVREVLHGEINSVEILFSNIVDEERTNEFGRELQAMALKLIDSEKIHDSFKRYANNQVNKMNIFDPDKRTPKFAVAYIRSLANGCELLRTGTITNPIGDFTFANGEVIDLRSKLLAIKNCPWQAFDVVRPMCWDLFAKMQVEISLAFHENPTMFKPDLEWIRDFVRRAYGV